jgi:hypothetical protein
MFEYLFQGTGLTFSKLTLVDDIIYLRNNSCAYNEWIVNETNNWCFKEYNNKKNILKKYHLKVNDIIDVSKFK